MQEIKTSIPHLSNYDITPDGKVYLLDKELKQQHDSKNYKTITLRTDFDGRQTFKVHRLVAAAYVPNPDPDIFNQVNHKNGNKHDNNAMNLEWCTNLQNMRHAIANGLVNCSKAGSQNGRALITEDTVRAIRSDREIYGLQHKEISQQYGLSTRQVGKILRGEAWSHVE